MKPELIFLPMIAQVMLSGMIWVYMYTTRFKEMKTKRIHPQQVSVNATGAQLLPDSYRVAENFTNQFELPVLFYVLILSLYITGRVDMLYLALCSAFVLLRFVHSFIHVGYNKVIHRFYVYAVGSIILWLMWLLFAVQIIRLV